MVYTIVIHIDKANKTMINYYQIYKWLFNKVNNNKDRLIIFNVIRN